MNTTPFLPQLKPGLAKTSITNQHARAINSLVPPLRTGEGDNPGFIRWVTLVRVDGEEGRSGFYSANAMLDEMNVNVTTGTGWSDIFLEGESCVLMNQPEVGFSNSHRIASDGSVYVAAIFCGMTLEDEPRPLYATNYAKGVRNVDFDEVRGCLRQTFQDKEDPSTADYDDITCAEACPPGSSATEISMF